MSSRSKEKMAAAFRKLFRSSQKIGEQEGAVGGQGCSAGNGSASPARRLIPGYHRDAVTPAEVNPVVEKSAASVGPAPRRSVVDFFRSRKSNNSGGNEKQAGPSSITQSKTIRSRRLMKELKEIQRLQHHLSEPVFTAELVNDNLFEWHVRLYRVDSESELATDMRDMGITYILLHLVFPDNFPFSPPFMRVISPRIEKGFVMEGGAICMELLTPRGWASAYTVEAIIMQFAASIVKGHGRIAKKPKSSKEFNRRSAEESFRSLVKTHDKYGWVTPPLSDG